jgi:DNA polymerase III subunit delta'
MGLMDSADTFVATLQGQEQIRSRLALMSSRPQLPNLLLIEGGNARQRMGMALFWAACLNCTAPARPCLNCRTCNQISLGVHQDVIVLDGAGETIKIGMVRELLPLMGQAPKSEGVRVIVLAEGQEMTTEAANCLLKSMEEPAPGNVFVLTAPQREGLLPTIVSRSWAVTLGWPGPDASPEAVETTETILRFARTGQGWFRLTSSKGAVDTALAGQVVCALQARWIDALSGRAKAHDVADTEWILKGLHLLDRAQEGLSCGVTPALVLDWLAIGLWEGRRAQGGGGMDSSSTGRHTG